MHGYYLDLIIEAPANPEYFISRVMYRLHGFLKCNADASVALDFPGWIYPHADAARLVSSPGRCLRLFGTQRDLFRFIEGVGLHQLLSGTGVTIKSVREVPVDVSGWVEVVRNNRVSRLKKLIHTPSRIRAGDADLMPGTDFDQIGRMIGVSTATAIVMEGLSRELATERSRAIEFRVRSTSTNRNFTLWVSRSAVCGPVAPSYFSNYGLCLKGGCLPVF